MNIQEDTMTKLRTLAEAAVEAHARQNLVGMIHAENAYRRVVTPAIVLVLLDELEALASWKVQAKHLLNKLDALAVVADAPLGHPIIEAAISELQRLQEQVEAVKDLHKPIPVYDECEHDADRGCEPVELLPAFRRAYKELAARETAGTKTWRHILEGFALGAFCETDSEDLRDELIAVATLAIEWIEAIDRREDEA